MTRKQFHLEFRRHFADFVEKKRTAIGHLNAPFFVGDSASERPFDVAEKLAFQEFSGNGAAVNCNKWFGGTRAIEVNRFGEEFFTGSGLPVD
jgi:hypothetical protein